MRFIKHINELSYEVNQNHIAVIKRDCKPFLSFMKKLHWKYLFQRYTRMTNDFDTRYTRKDRRPSDTPLSVHNMFDDLFKMYFKWKPRSESLFVWPHHIDTNILGAPFNVVFPMGEFDLLWSPEVDDLYSEWDDYLSIGSKDDEDGDWNDAEKNWADKIVQTYKTKKDIDASTRLKGEVMIKCDKYYIVRFKLGMGEYIDFMSELHHKE